MPITALETVLNSDLASTQPPATTFLQLVRFSIVGIASNAALYLGFLALTGMGCGPKLAMSFMYVTGVALSFLGNRSWTFAHRGSRGTALRRHVAVYVAGYIFQWTLLFVLADLLRQPHALVQAGGVVVVAAGLFLAQKYWVFSGRD